MWKWLGSLVLAFLLAGVLGAAAYVSGRIYWPQTGLTAPSYGACVWALFWPFALIATGLRVMAAGDSSPRWRRRSWF